MKVFGLDPGSRYTGYGIVENINGRLVHVTSGRINAARATDFSERLKIIYNSLHELLTEYKCTHAAAERVFVSTNVQSALKLGHARGVALLAISHADLELTEYTPTKIKQAVTGYGHAEKGHVQMIVSSTLNILPTTLSSDASDALAVAICHARTLEFESKLDNKSPQNSVEYTLSTFPNGIHR